MPPHPLSVAVVRALDVLVDEGALPWQGGRPDADEVDDARVAGHGGGYVSSLPMRLSGRAGLPPHEMAGLLAARLSSCPGVGSAHVGGPGYLRVEPEWPELVRLALGAPTASPGGHRALDPLPPGELRQDIRDAVAEVGADAVRFALALRTTARSRLDLAVLGRADEANPVYAVQLAHAGLAAALRQASAAGVAAAAPADVEPAHLDAPPARALVAAVAEAEAVASRAVRLGRPDLVARHLLSTAEAALRYLSSCRLLPSGEEEADDGHRARLRLATAARDELAHGLDLLGVSAPERM